MPLLHVVRNLSNDMYCALLITKRRVSFSVYKHRSFTRNAAGVKTVVDLEVEKEIGLHFHLQGLKWGIIRYA